MEKISLRQYLYFSNQVLIIESLLKRILIHMFQDNDLYILLNDHYLGKINNIYIKKPNHNNFKTFEYVLLQLKDIVEVNENKIDNLYFGDVIALISILDFGFFLNTNQVKINTKIKTLLQNIKKVHKVRNGLLHPWSNFNLSWQDFCSKAKLTRHWKLNNFTELENLLIITRNILKAIIIFLTESNFNSINIMTDH